MLHAVRGDSDPLIDLARYKILYDTLMHNVCLKLYRYGKPFLQLSQIFRLSAIIYFYLFVHSYFHYPVSYFI